MACKYDFEPFMVRSPTDDSFIKLYRVRIYVIFDGFISYSFFHEHTMLEHYNAALKRGSDVSCFVNSVVVSPTKFRNIFNEISEYVSRTYFG